MLFTKEDCINQSLFRRLYQPVSLPTQLSRLDKTLNKNFEELRVSMDVFRDIYIDFFLNIVDIYENIYIYV